MMGKWEKIMYYKISMRAGHHGIGQFAQQSVYVSDKNVLQAFEIARRFPSLKHHRSIPLNTVQICEDEYIANAVIDSRKKHFDNEIVPLHIDIIIKKVLPSVIRERRINPNGEKGKLAPKFFELCYAYQNATSDE